MSTQEKKIKLIYHSQIVPSRYTIDNQLNAFKYKFIQKMNINSLNLLSFSFYNIFENVNQFYNQLSVFINNVTYTVVIPSYNYSFWDIFDLQIIVQTQLNLQIPLYTWQISLTGNNNKFTEITNTQNIPFKFVYQLIDNQNQILRYFGYGTQLDTAYKSEQISQVSQYPYNVQVTTGIQVIIKNASNTWSETLSCVALVPLSAGITQLNHYQSPFYQCNRIILDPKNPYPIQDIEISLLDDLNNQMNILDSRISMNLMFEQFERT